MRALLTTVVILAVLHGLLGVMSVCLGVTASIQADVWLAHSVSPIWSGGFFTVTGILGFACAKKRTAYMIMCFTAFSIVSLVTAVVSIQLLRLGLVNQTTDGDTYQKENKDEIIMVALGVAAVECLCCVVSAFTSCRLARTAKKEMERKRDGKFHIQESEESDNNNKCAVYSVEKGYHNPYVVSHHGNDSPEVDGEAEVHEDHVQILVKDSSGCVIGDPGAGDRATHGDSTVNMNMTRSHKDHSGPYIDITSKTQSDSTNRVARTENQRQARPAEGSGVTYHWKLSARKKLQKDGKTAKHRSNGVLRHKGDEDKERTVSKSVRVEIEEHTDEEENSPCKTNVLVANGNIQENTRSDVEMTSLP